MSYLLNTPQDISAANAERYVSDADGASHGDAGGEFAADAA